MSHIVYLSNQAAIRRGVFRKVLSSRITVSTKFADAIKRKCDLLLCVQKTRIVNDRISFAKADHALPDTSIFFRNTLISHRIVHSGNKHDSALQRGDARANIERLTKIAAVSYRK